MSIPPQPWMTTPQVKKLLDVIPDANQTMRFVGGCVRDGLLGKSVKDIDLATTYQPLDMLHLLKKGEIKTFPVGLEHGTVLAVVDGIPFEITTLRKDIETYGRHAKVEFTDDWLEDAKRRDFTFNALYLTPQGKLYDPWQGYDDLQEGRVRFIGNPRERIQEDYLRILRFFRFYARFGKKEPDLETLMALKELAIGLDRISGERIHRELFRLLEYPDPRCAFDLMVETGVFEKCLGLKQLTAHFKQLVELEQREGLPAGVLRRFLSLYLDEPTPLLKVEHRLKLSNKEKRHLTNLQTILSQNRLTDNEILYHYGAVIFQDFVLLKAQSSPEELRRKLTLAEQWQVKKLPLTGRDLVKIGIDPGPGLGMVLTQVETWWIAQEFLPTKSECLAYLKGIKGTVF